MRKSRRGDQAVFYRHRLAPTAELREQLSPAQADDRVQGDALDPADPLLKPVLEPLSSCATRQQEDAESDLAQDDRIDDDRTLIAPQPLHYRGIGLGLGRLGEDVGVDEILQSVSVDSDSTGTK